jgi:hypothetical protein
VAALRFLISIFSPKARLTFSRQSQKVVEILSPGRDTVLRRVTHLGWCSILGRCQEERDMTNASREQEIRKIAYSKWEKAGWPAGDGMNFWLEAEQELLDQEACQSACDHDSTSACSQSLVSDPPPLLLAKVKANSRKKAG